jgi:hypothetical protein
VPYPPDRRASRSAMFFVKCVAPPHGSLRETPSRRATSTRSTIILRAEDEPVRDRCDPALQHMYRASIGPAGHQAWFIASPVCRLVGLARSWRQPTFDRLV